MDKNPANCLVQEVLAACTCPPRPQVLNSNSTTCLVLCECCGVMNTCSYAVFQRKRHKRSQSVTVFEFVSQVGEVTDPCVFICLTSFLLADARHDIAAMQVRILTFNVVNARLLMPSSTRRTRFSHLLNCRKLDTCNLPAPPRRNS